MRVWFVVLGALAGLACSSQKTPEAGLTVTSAWIRPAPPTAEVLAGYMTVHNASDAPFVVLAASSPRFQSVEFHHMRMEEGQMFMRPMQQINVPANQHATLEPGADHLMMIKPTAAVNKGERIPVTLLVERLNQAPENLEVHFLVRD